MLATGKNNKADDQKSALFLHQAGEEAIRLYNTFAWDNDADKSKLDKIKEKFEEHCNAHTSEAFVRNRFFTRVQEKGEPVDTFVTDVKNLAKSCGFLTLADGLVRDQIIQGIGNKSVSERLLSEREIDLKKTIDICRAAEASKSQW